MEALIHSIDGIVWERTPDASRFTFISRQSHDLLGYATDYAFGQQRGVQTLVLKSRHRSAYVRLHWDTLMSDTAADRQLVDELIQNAIRELR